MQQIHLSVKEDWITCMYHCTGSQRVENGDLVVLDLVCLKVVIKQIGLGEVQHLHDPSNDEA